MAPSRLHEMAPRVRAPVTAPWQPFDLEPPTLAASSGARVDSWLAMRPSADGPSLVAGCVATPIPGWVEDMRPAADARVTAFAGAVASRVIGRPARVMAGADGNLAVHVDGDAADGSRGAARTFLGFDSANLYACVAVCVNPREFSSSARDCAALVRDTHLEGSAEAPAPGHLLMLASMALHQPKLALTAFVGISLLFAVLAIVTRPKPRSRV